MTPAQITGSTFRGGLLRGVLAGAVALLVVYGLLFFTSGEQTATAVAPCEQGTAVPNPTDNPGLVSDCAILLAAKDTLRGTATLNWSADAAMSEWTGVTISGSPQRVTGLSLTYARLNGSIPAGLGGLGKLENLQLSNNTLTGSIPPELGSLAELDILYLFNNELTGAIPAALGNLADLRFLGLNDNRLTGTVPNAFATLWRVQDLYLENNQLSGAIPALLGDLGLRSLYLAGNQFTGCVPADLRSITYGDLATLGLSYCTAETRRTLTTSKSGAGSITPAPGTHSYRSGARVRVRATPGGLFRVASWGGDCATTPATELDCVLTMDANKTASVTFERTTYTLTATATGGGSVSPSGTTTQFGDREVTLTATWTEATHVFSGWEGDCRASGTEATCTLTMDADKTVTAAFAERCATSTDPTCIRVVYAGAPADYTEVSAIPADVLLTANSDGRYYVERGLQYTVVTAARLPEGWTRFYLEPDPAGDARTRLGLPAHQAHRHHLHLHGDGGRGRRHPHHLRPQAGAPLRPSPGPTASPRSATPSSRPCSRSRGGLPRATTATTPRARSPPPGSYAFLSDPDDTGTAVTTYEALRDGTTTALLIHRSDAHGASQAALYDEVEAGDLFEWHKADDCFVRYKVMEVKPDPTGSVPRKLLAVEWMTYAYTGCSGTISSSTAVGMIWGEVPDLGGVNLPAPVVHGRFHLVPEGWEGTIEDVTYHDPPDESPAFEERVATTLEAARALNLPYWREPTLPEGWTLSRAWEGGLDAPRYGFVAIYLTEPLEFPDGRMLRQTGLKVLGAFADTRRGTQQSSYADGRNVRETRIIAGRPATILWSPPGPNYLWNADVHVRVYDPDNGSSYTFIVSAPHRSDLAADGNAKLENALALVKTFFESDEEDE